MPTRRSVLGGAAAGAAGGLAGCLSRLAPAREGELQLKAISVGWTHEDRRYRDQVLVVTLDEAGVVDGRVDEPLADLVDDPTEIVIPEDVHDSLAARFATVEYALGFCGPAFGDDGETGCRNTEAPRAAFNRAHFGDRAEVRIVERSGGDEFEVLEVTEGPRREWRSDVTTFDFEAVHADDGL